MEAGYYRQVAKKQTFEAIPLPAMRGTIYGADGQVLAMTVETYTVTADPPQIADKPLAAQELAGPLGLTQQQVLNLLEHPTSKDYVVLAKGVSAPERDQGRRAEHRRRRLRRRRTPGTTRTATPPRTSSASRT